LVGYSFFFTNILLDLLVKWIFMLGFRLIPVRFLVCRLGATETETPLYPFHPIAKSFAFSANQWKI